MKEFTDIEETQSTDLGYYLKEGWEVIDYYKRDEKLIYVVGYPYRKEVEDLKALIKAYEEFGFKEQLFKAIAEKNNNDYAQIKEYGSSTQLFFRNETTEFMNRYEALLGNNKKYGTEEEHTDYSDGMYINDSDLPF